MLLNLEASLQFMESSNSFIYNSKTITLANCTKTSPNAPVADIWVSVAPVDKGEFATIQWETLAKGTIFLPVAVATELEVAADVVVELELLVL